MKVTTALRKISALRKKIKGIQGGQGAGKTIAILILLCNHASSNENKEIYVASEELSKMKLTVIKDFVKVMRGLGLFDPDRWIGETLYRFPNGSFIKFLGLDKEDIGKGLRSDVMFVNEANKINFDTYQQLTSRAKQIFIDFNPDRKFWFHTEVQNRPDCDSLILTFRDNEYLSPEERSEILGYKRKGYKRDELGNYAVDKNGQLIVLNQYWANKWRVYGLGHVGVVEGRIYTWHPIPLAEYIAMPVQEYFGNDWGKVDPWAIVGAKYHDGNLYLREYWYKSENVLELTMNQALLKSIRSQGSPDPETGEQHDGLVAYIYSKLGIPYDANIICDSNRPNKIRSLRRAGWEYAQSVGGKLDLENRVATLSGLNIYYTADSVNIEAEQETYAYAKDRNGVQLEKPIDQDNHAIDAGTYVTQWMFEQGIIKHI